MARLHQNEYTFHLPKVLAKLKKLIEMDENYKISADLSELFGVTEMQVGLYFRCPSNKKTSTSTPITADKLFTFCDKYQIDPRCFLINNPYNTDVSK